MKTVARIVWVLALALMHCQAISFEYANLYANEWKLETQIEAGGIGERKWLIIRLLNISSRNLLVPVSKELLDYRIVVTSADGGLARLTKVGIDSVDLEKYRGIKWVEVVSGRARIVRVPLDKFFVLDTSGQYKVTCTWPNDAGRMMGVWPNNPIQPSKGHSLLVPKLQFKSEAVFDQP